MFTYLFFPLPNDEAIAVKWTGSRPFAEIRDENLKRIAVFKSLAENPEYADFLGTYFKDGLPVFTGSIELNLALNQGPAEPQKGIFLDMLDLGNPKSTGNSGYGFYAADVREGTAKVNYLLKNETIMISCELEDDNRRRDTLQCTVPLALFLQGLETLHNKTNG